MLLGNLKRTTVEDFQRKAEIIHNGKYDYSHVNWFQSGRTFVEIICKIHGVFSQPVRNHLKGLGCPKCGSEQSACTRGMRFESFVKKANEIHHDKYQYSSVGYKNALSKIDIGCPSHGIFNQSAKSHLQGQGCRKCVLKMQFEVEVFLRKAFSGWEIKVHKLLWKQYMCYYHKRYCDFWLEHSGTRIVIEYDGEQHFRPIRFGGISQKRADVNFARQQMIDALDTEFCKENGILLFRIKYNEDKQARIEELHDLISKNSD